MFQIIFLLAIIWCVVFMLSRRSQVPKGQLSDRQMTPSEKTQTWIICLLNPLWGGVILYYGWIRRLPTMAKKANKISFITFGIEALLFIVFMVVVYLLAAPHT